MILLETTFKEQLTVSWEEDPTYEGFKKALEEMKDSGVVTNEELAHLTTYINGYEMELRDSLLFSISHVSSIKKMSMIHLSIT